MAAEDPECRILVISASLDSARAAVKLIKAFVGDPSELPSSNPIPWTIKNKYYSADVHFHLVEYAHWDPQLALRVPAVIFVWTRGQLYAEHVFALQGGIARFEPEVTLAISLGNEPPHHDDPPEGPDSFLADHGFEYIDGERTRPPTTTTTTDADHYRRATSDDYDEDSDADAVQGLPRVVDALSTIMWPSMVRQRDSGKRRSQAPTQFDFDVLRTEEDTLAALMEADAADHGVPQTRAGRVQKEMAALERDARLAPILVPDIMHIPSGDPWVSSNHNNNNSTPSTASGFDDDFAAFVSAPALPAVSVESSTTVPAPAPAATTSGSAIATVTAVAVGGGHAHAFLDAPTLRPSHTGGSYRSLRSSGAFDVDDRVGYEALDDDRSSFGFSPEHDDEHVFDDDDANPRRTSTASGSGGGGGQRGGERRLGLDDSDVPFDLTNILSALHSVREDVAGIEDEAQRRATTARFASEFVFKRMGVDGTR
ncbi:hypothetical protein BJV78DRAFT_1202454 [Lactifluus subvellereus]|nr:hypothetical protein BJV78DRAFT_1202454 [Lactifluus subvellereus]